MRRQGGDTQPEARKIEIPPTALSGDKQSVAALRLHARLRAAGLFDMLSDRQSSTFWASGSVLAGAEARGTRLVPSGCSVAGLARRTCDTRARPRGRARRGFSPNMSDRLPRLLWASPCGKALAGRWRTIPAAAWGCPGRSRAGGGASRRSNWPSETARVLSESQSRRCRSFADGSPHVRAMRSPSDLARGGARAVVGALD